MQNMSNNRAGRGFSICAASFGLGARNRLSSKSVGFAGGGGPEKPSSASTNTIGPAHPKPWIVSSALGRMGNLGAGP